MTRKLLALALLTWLTPTAKSQDMPIAQILIEGEGWKKVDGKPGHRQPYYDQEVILWEDWKTTFRWACCSGQFVEARPANAPENATFIPYCQLRMKRGEKGETAIFVTGLTTDKDGRIYAATEIGVQVFDPTGRLCGVLTPAAEGKPGFMSFEGDQLTMWIGDTKYTRKLNATGAK